MKSRVIGWLLLIILRCCLDTVSAFLSVYLNPFKFVSLKDLLTLCCDALGHYIYHQKKKFL